MSILSTLLTGGTIVAKVCQSLATALSATDNETGIQVSLSSMNINGVRFMRSNAEDGSTMKTYAYNSCTNGKQSVSFPNLNESVGGATLMISPTKKVVIDNFICDNVSPDTNVVIGPATDSVENYGAGPEEQFRLVFKNVTIGGGRIFTGSFALNCTTSQLIILGVLTTTLYAAHKIFSCCFKKGGQTVQDYKQIEPVKKQLSVSQGKMAEENEYVFDVPFCEYGFKDGDVLDEVILSLAAKKISSTADNFSKENQSLHPVEMRLLQELETKINQQL